MPVVTNHQYEAPILPTSWTGDEKKFYTRLIDVLDDIYSKYGRLSLKDLSPAVRKQLSELVDDTTFTTAIEQTEREIRLKADASTVDALGQTVSSHSTLIQQTAEAISAKASQSSVDALGNRVTNAETSLTLKADQATLTSTANNLQSQIDAVPGEITLAVSNVSVGGTNLLRYSKEVKIGSDLWSLSTNVSTYADADLGYTIIWFNQSGATSNVWRQAWSPFINLGADWVGKQVTISGWVYSPNYTAIDGKTFVALNLSTGDRSRLNWVEKVLIYNSTNQWGPDVVSDVSAPVNGKIHRFSITITLDASIFSGTGVFADNTVMWAAFMTERNADLRFYGLKAEWGNKATAWSPAPEDPSSGVVNNSITIDTEGIKMSSSDVFQLVATNSSKQSYIDILGLFTVDKTGSLTAASGSYDSLTVGGQRVLTLSDIGIPIKVAATQPTGSNFIWVQPTGGGSVSSVRYTGYTAPSRNDNVNFGINNPISRSFTSEDGVSTLSGSTYTYELEFEIFSAVDTQLTGVTFRATATKGGSTVTFNASSAITLNMYNHPVITLTASSSVNLASNTSAITVAITATASPGLDGLFLNSKQYMTLTISTTSSGSGVQTCNVKYVP